MHFSKTLTAAVITVAALASPLIAASQLPRELEGSAIHAHAPLAMRRSSGWNDWNCKPSSDHPRALVLVHGFIGNGINNWLYMAPRFVAEGYCVFSLTYGQLNDSPLMGGLDKMENSAQQLSDYVDKVLAATNTTQVDMFGHSEGSLMPRYYLRFLNGGPKVHKFAAIGSVVYGTALQLLPDSLGLSGPAKKVFERNCRSCSEFEPQSDFLRNLNSGGDTVPSVQYLMIVSKFDEIMKPYRTGFLRDENPKVRNQVLQDWCSHDISPHLLQAFSPVVFNGVHAFFTPSAQQTITCADILH
ncbi:hypothetical protein BGZ67_004154 [Mortierella alpina]|nr:hypothetical protein BGZ67_004154 [Mortierella alpina]